LIASSGHRRHAAVDDRSSAVPDRAPQPLDRLDVGRHRRHVDGQRAFRQPALEVAGAMQILEPRPAGDGEIDAEPAEEPERRHGFNS
jgi:hypothetical protein